MTSRFFAEPALPALSKAEESGKQQILRVAQDDGILGKKSQAPRGGLHQLGKWYKVHRSHSAPSTGSYFLIQELGHFRNDNREQSGVNPEWPWHPGLPRRPRRHASVPIRQGDLRQTLGVDDVSLLENLVPIEQKGGQSANLVRAERSLSLWGHGGVAIVPYATNRRKQ